MRSGPLPAHRKGTTGRRWRKFRAQHTDQATHCQRCGKPLIRDAQCAHPTHQRLGYCPTYHAYPTLEHPHRLIDGGKPTDPGNALVYCYACNAGGAAQRQGTSPKKKLNTSRVW